ncbi:Calx-beta domain-containing protein [Urbifossiella limnaea]|uniref:Thermophilic serine proteinase n=1 Tax=Urbifossiella limnaea TaxID=2528023 RepID=A0A517XQB0_9BACT|nr:Calx-beta domain-containing protein [Urbifossiella limnaea]QDU19695.1 Thermophilic serine proteinase precursor [Urbifossiella limnaea]
MRTPRTRKRLAVEALEDRTAPDASAGTTPLDARPFTSTEVLVGVRGADPLGQLAGFALVNGRIDAADSQVILTTADGVSLVEVQLAGGADPQQTVELLAAQSWTAWAQPNYVVAPGAGPDWTPNDPSYAAAGQYFHTKSQTNLAWDITKGSSTILVGVTDDGLGYNHPDLAANVWVNPGETAGNGVDDDGNGFIDDVRGWDFNASDNNPLPAGDDSHGTHVGGIIAARSNNGVGVAGTAGGDNTAGSGVRLVGLRWDGTNGWTAARVAAAYTYAADNGVRVVNSSYNFDFWVSGAGVPDPAVVAALDYAYDAGVLLMLSAGNNGELDAPRGVFQQPLFVASLDQNDARSSFSNYGSYVDLAGHGSSILSTTTNTNGTGVNYEVYSGTSMSTPHAAGVAALIWSANPTWTRDQVAAQMLGTTDTVNAVAGNVAGTLGTGRVNAFRALTQTLAAPVFTNFTLAGAPTAVQAVTVTVPRRLLPASVTAANFELRGNGPDDTFGTADDVLIPVQINGGAAYRMGTNELRLTQPGGATLPADRYRLTAFAGAGQLRDPFGTALDGNANGTGGDDYVVEFGAEPSLAGRVFEDWAGNAAADANDPGVAGRQVYLDANANGGYDATLATTPFASGAINLAIPDNNATGVTNTRTVSGVAGVVTRVTVTVSVTHPYISDLVIDLTGPTGTTVTLVSNRGGNGDNFTATVFDDAAATAIGSGAAPFTGSFRPETPLSALTGGSPNGGWSLRVRDLGPADLGTLANWTLTLTTGEQATTTTAAGAYGFGALAAGTYAVRTTTPAGWSATGPAGGAHTQTIAAGASVTGLNFGTVRQNAVYGQMVNDLNGNGVRDGGEPVMAGWRVFDDRNGNGALDGGEVNALADALGNYVLTGLAAGATAVRVERQAGYRTTLGVAGLPLTAVAGATYHGRDFAAVADTSPPTADVTDVTPDPRATAVPSVTIVFAEAVTGFDLADLSLTRDGGANLLTGSQTLTTSDTVTWTLGNLSGLTAAPGTYVLALTAAGSGVQDAAQNTMAADASDSWVTVTTPSVSVSDVTVGEAGGPAVVTVTLSGPSPDTILVPYATADGTATAGADYTAAGGTLTFAPGETTKTVSVAVLNDPLDEADETFVLNLGTPTNATTADGQAVATITDDDPTPSLSITGVTQAEGDSGTTAYVFTVTLSAASGRAVSVNYATADGTATAGGDYAAASGTLTFAPGETAKTVTVLVTADALDEDDETFTLGLSGATNATIATGTGTGTITDDDAAPGVSINSVSAAEGSSGTTPLVFTVSLSAPSGKPVTVTYATADGTATAGVDYAAAAGTLTFAPGETSKLVTVLLTGDALDEPDETFTLGLAGAVNATIATATAAGTILDDDPLPGLSIDSVTREEGNSGATPFTFTVTLSAASGRTVSVNYVTANGTATTVDGDYTFAGGTLTFAPGETTRALTVQAAGDPRNEADETFAVLLSGATNGTVTTPTGTGTVANDDPLPALSVSAVSQAEGTGGTTTVTVTVTLSAVSGQTVTVGYATADGTATVADGDYAATSGTITFAPGVTTRTFAVAVTPDARNEADETIGVTLAAPTNATLGVPSAAVTVADDDPVPALSVNSVSLAEGTGGATAVAFTVTLSAVSGRTVTVSYSTADGTAAAADGDYTAAGGTLTFAPGETTKTVTVQAAGDARNEDDETFTIGLGGATNATVAAGTGTSTLLDDDPLPALSVDSVSLAEGDGGGTAFTFTVTLSAVSGRTVSVGYATADGTATVADGDYAATSGTLTFAPGVTTRTFTVTAAGDLRNETDETFAVSLSGATNAIITAAAGTGTILNDDPLPTLSVNAASVAEGGGLAFTVSLSAVSGQAVTVSYATADGTATAADYAAASGTLTFAPGETTKTVTVATTSDATFEPDETLTLDLSGVSNAVIATGTGTGTVLNDDAEPTATLSGGGSVGEFGGSATVAVTLSNPSYLPVTVTFALGGTATSTDYAAPPASVTIPAGQLTATVTITASTDTADEPDETVTLAIGTVANGGAAGSPVVVTIADDDLPEAAAAGFDLTEDVVFTTPTSLLAAANAQPGSVVELVGTAPGSGVLTLTADGTFTFAPAANVHGTVGFSYRVRNPAGEVSAPAVVELRVAAVNDAPTFAASPSQTDPRRAGPQVVPGWASAISAGPPDEAGQRLTFEVTADNPTLFAVQPAIDPATGTLTYTPGSGFGSAVVTVRLHDDAGGTSAARTFTVHLLRYRDDDLPTHQDEVGLIGVGSGDGGTVAAFRGDGQDAGTMSPFAGASARVVTADVTGDGVADVIAATGPGVRSRVVVLDGATGAAVRTILPFEDSFTGGLFVAAADIDGDGKAEIAVSPDTGGGGRVTVYGEKGTVADFFGIDDAAYRGGARVTFGDLDGDGLPDLVVAAGFGGGPRVAVYDGATLTGTPARLVNDFFAFPGTDATNLRNGVFVAAGDVDGDGFADLAFGGGPGGAPRVFVLSGRLVSAGRVDESQAAPVGNFFVAGNAADRGGVRVAVKDADGDDRADVVVGSGERSAARVRVYAGTGFGGGGEPGDFLDLEPFGGAVLAGGVYVG